MREHGYFCECGACSYLNRILPEYRPALTHDERLERRRQVMEERLVSGRGLPTGEWPICDFCGDEMVVAHSCEFMPRDGAALAYIVCVSMQRY